MKGLLLVAVAQVLFTITVCLASVKGLPPTDLNVTGIAGGSLLLNCSLGSHHKGQVSWLRPHDNVIVSRDYHVISEEETRRRNRVMIIGDPTKGEYHLLLRYTLFPQDAGTWLCSSESVTNKVNVVLLVRPNTEVPRISPSSASAVRDFGSEDESNLQTFTCTAQFAFPPVQLTWKKEFGPDVPYHVTLPSIVVSRSGTMSSSVRLILSSSNVHSQFVCIASHPTFFGKVYPKTLRFHVKQNHEAQPLVQESGKAKVQSGSSLIQLDTLDRVFLLLIISMIILAFCIGCLMNKFHSKWELDVPFDRIDQNLNTQALCEVVDGEKVKRRTSTRSRQRFACKVTATLVLMVLLISAIIFAFPIYYKSVTIPAVDTDEIASVMAGSALWLDCRMLVQPPTSILQIDWLHNGQPFYHQYYLNGQNIGFPHNSTKGFMMGVRVSSQGLGHITIWPVTPGEDGQYACQAFLSSGDDGATEERRKTTTVFVLMGPIINYGLIVALVVALVSALGLFGLFIFHVLRIHRKEDNKIEDEDA